MRTVHACFYRRLVGFCLHISTRKNSSPCCLSASFTAASCRKLSCSRQAYSKVVIHCLGLWQTMVRPDNSVLLDSRFNIMHWSFIETPRMVCDYLTFRCYWASTPASASHRVEPGPGRNFSAADWSRKARHRADRTQSWCNRRVSKRKAVPLLYTLGPSLKVSSNPVAPPESRVWGRAGCTAYWTSCRSEWCWSRWHSQRKSTTSFQIRWASESSNHRVHLWLCSLHRQRARDNPDPLA